jgi:N-acetylneuraminic acid mutarotase
MKSLKSTLVVLLVFSFVIPTFSFPLVSAAEDYWTPKAKMPSTRTSFGVAVVDGKIYAIGGHPFGGVTTDANEEYDPATDTWVSRKKMPGIRAWFGTAVYDNEIYVIGGAWFLSGSELNEIMVYAPATDTWNTNKTAMPTARSGIEANIVDDKIFVIGGRNSNEIFDVNEVYDPTIDVWETKTPIPTPVYNYASAVVDKKIYIIGGFTLDINGIPYRVDFNQIYDVETDSWSLGNPVPVSNGANAVATSGLLAPKRIYVIGGGLNQVYDPATDSWMNATPMPSANRLENFDDVNLAVLNDQIYAMGGVFAEDESRYSINYQYAPFGYIPEFPSWTPLLISLIAVVAVLVIYRRRVSKNRGRADK